LMSLPSIIIKGTSSTQCNNMVCGMDKSFCGGVCDLN
jgi:hypothetical protein